MPPEVVTKTATDDEIKKKKEAELERKRAELRKRMEEATKGKKGKKSFMNPERKKKLRLLLRRKAAEELKKEQERKAAERSWTIAERCGEPEDLEWSNKEDLIDICEYYHQRIMDIESEKWDIELEIKRKHFEIIDLNTKVNDLRGKFQKPLLKKVSKYENKFAKLQKKAAEFNYRNQLKLVKKHEVKDGGKDDDKKGQGAKTEGKEGEEKTDETGEPAAAEAAVAAAEGEVTNEGVKEGEQRLEEGEAVQKEPAEGALEGDRLGTDGTPAVEGSEVPPEGESRLQGDEAPPDGETRLEGSEAPQVEGEVKEGEAAVEIRLEGQEIPTEDEAQLPVTPQPEHTEEDLWNYLKEAVSSVHPSTVEEFVQNLIGTLEHVPKEYLEPVIEANIRRANTPSVTDGEHLAPTPENIHPEGEVILEESSIEKNQEENTTSPLEATELPTELPVVAEDLPEPKQDETPELPAASSAVEVAE